MTNCDECPLCDEQAAALRKQSALLDKTIEYIRAYVEGHKTYDYPMARELIAEYERMRGGKK